MNFIVGILTIFIIQFLQKWDFKKNQWESDMNHVYLRYSTFFIFGILIGIFIVDWIGKIIFSFFYGFSFVIIDVMFDLIFKKKGILNDIEKKDIIFNDVNKFKPKFRGSVISFIFLHGLNRSIGTLIFALISGLICYLIKK